MKPHELQTIGAVVGRCTACGASPVVNRAARGHPGEKVAVGFFRKHLFDLAPSMQRLVTGTTIIASNPEDFADLTKSAAELFQRKGPIDIVYSTSLIAEVTSMVDKAVPEFAALAFQSLDAEDRADIAKMVAERLRKPQSVEAVAGVGKKAIERVIETLVERELEAAMPVLLHRISELVDKSWEEHVDAVVKKKLALALDKIKAEMGKP